MRLVRFINPEGHLRAGVDLGNGTADVFDQPQIPQPTYRPTGRVETIATRWAPIAPTNLYGIGLNYQRHAQETGAELPEHPVLFMKPTSTVSHPEAPIRLPACQQKGPEVDYECELAVVIGREGRDIPEERALEHVLGYTAANDVSARRWQKNAGGGQWIRGKSFDTFCPLGPVLVTADELTDPQQLAIRTHLNGRTMQESNTSDMIFSIAKVIAFLSQDTTLLPGTTILTGTPEGVGFTRQPPVFLSAGDEVQIEIEQIGTLTNPVAEAT